MRSRVGRGTGDRGSWNPARSGPEWHHQEAQDTGAGEWGPCQGVWLHPEHQDTGAGRGFRAGAQWNPVDTARTSPWLQGQSGPWPGKANDDRMQSPHVRGPCGARVGPAWSPARRCVSHDGEGRFTSLLLSFTTGLSSTHPSCQRVFECQEMGLLASPLLLKSHLKSGVGLDPRKPQLQIHCSFQARGVPGVQGLLRG